MPVYKSIVVNDLSNVLIWKIEESFENLNNGIELTSDSRSRLDGMKSEIHRKGFLSVRHLLKCFGYTDYDLYYDDLGKPHLVDGNHISISHSFEFSAIYISDVPVGIDLEKQRDKVQLISSKFVSATEFLYLKNNKFYNKRLLTIIWGAKEALYKLYGCAGLSFKDDIEILKFDISDTFLNAKINFKNKVSNYLLNFIEFEAFTCVYGIELLN